MNSSKTRIQSVAPAETAVKARDSYIGTTATLPQTEQSSEGSATFTV